jgi:hypothetical protein
MNNLTTQQAFEQLINAKEIKGINPSTLKTYRKRYYDGKLLSIQKIEEILQKHGYKVVQEKLWTFART